MGLDLVAVMPVRPGDWRELTSEERGWFDGISPLIPGWHFQTETRGADPRGAIRGSVYDSLVRDVTDRTLYCDYLWPDNVAIIAGFLQEWIADHPGAMHQSRLAAVECRTFTAMDAIERARRQVLAEAAMPLLTAEHVAAFARFLGVCTEHGLGLVGIR